MLVSRAILRALGGPHWGYPQRKQRSREAVQGHTFPLSHQCHKRETMLWAYSRSHRVAITVSSVEPSTRSIRTM